MKKMVHLVLIGEIIAICVLHAIKINQSSPEAIPSAIDKNIPVNIQKPDSAYVAFQR